MANGTTDGVSDSAASSIFTNTWLSIEAAAVALKVSHKTIHRRLLGFTPVGVSGYCIYPNSVFPADLLVGFDQTMYDFSLLYAPEEYSCNSSARMKVTAYMNGSPVGSNTAVANPGTWPTQTLGFSSSGQIRSVLCELRILL